MSGVSVVAKELSELKKHPLCPHGPTLLFKTLDNKKPRNFYACSACRDRKACSIFVWQDERETYRKRYWESKIEKFMTNHNQRNLYQTFINVQQMCVADRMYCNDCNEFELAKYQENHVEHVHVKGVSNDQLMNASSFLPPLDDSKKEAQYLFTETACKFIVDSVISLGFKYVLCVGTPRIHEYIANNCALQLESLLMDFDKRYLSFYSQLQFVWYNMFNHHFFIDASKEIYEAFLSNNKKNELIIITDPPFGGRVESLSSTFRIINSEHKALTKIEGDLPMFWVFPYFMEPQVTNSMENLKMLDYRVDYDNHVLFSNGPKARKQGSPVRIYTNLDPAKIPLPESDGYKFCTKCKRWVSAENQHCNECKNCTSKDGRTYVHCNKCNRCVKPTWAHCDKCERCALKEHKCETLKFTDECFHCKGQHKKSDCPQITKETKRKHVDVVEPTEVKLKKSKKDKKRK